MSVIREAATLAATPSATISRIAAGVGGYPEGLDAAALGANFARVNQAELMLVAVHPQPLVVLPTQMSWRTLEKTSAAMLSQTRDSLAPGSRLVVETDLSISRALARVVRREHRDLLVVGSSRHGAEGRVRIGRHTRQLLSHLDCPLAVAPRGTRDRPQHGFRVVGVGYDGSAESEAAVALAESIALAAGAELQLLGVVDDRVPPIGWSALAHGGAAVPRWEEVVLGELQSLREAAGSRAKSAEIPARADVLRGPPAEVLTRLSTEVDLLVIGSGHWGRVARLLLGGTGEALAHQAACPLLIVPRPDR